MSNVPLTFSPSKEYHNYRQKIGLKICSPDIGFYKKSTHNIINIEYCRLAKENINELLRIVRGLLFDKSNSETVLKNMASLTLTGSGLKNIAFGVKNNAEIPDRFIKDVFTHTKCSNIFIEYRNKKIVKYKGDDNKKYFILKDKKFSYDLPAFIQINREQNENIITSVINYLKNIVEERGKKFTGALDLYCGFGNITVFLSPYSNYITGVESSGFAVELGKENIKLNDINNIKFVKSDVSEFLNEIAKHNKKNFDLIVLDPPRAGIKGLTGKIAGLNPSHVIYVSCDMMTFLRDIKAFAEIGYDIAKINLIDMFPRTYHMEHIAFLRKKITV